MADRFGIHFGALCEPIGVQLAVQGMKARGGRRDLNLWQRQADAITLLAVHSLLSDAETARARRRLMKAIRKGVDDLW